MTTLIFSLAAKLGTSFLTLLPRKEPVQAMFSSKKWIMAILGAVIPLANSLFGWNLDAETLWQAVGPLMAYVLGQGLADFGKFQS